MKSELKDQAAKLRELALLEQESGLEDQDGVVSVLEREPELHDPIETDQDAMASEKATAPPALSDRDAEKKVRKKKQKKRTVKSPLPKEEASAPVDSKRDGATDQGGRANAIPKDAVSTNGFHKPERIQMDLPVYSSKDAASVILPAKPPAQKTLRQAPDPNASPQKNQTPQPDLPVRTPPPVHPEPSPGRVETIAPSSRFHFDTGTQVIAITGGKGGVGKSNIACNLGITFSRMGKNVLLMDADLSLANIDVLLGMTPKYNISHVISGEKKINEVVIPGPGGMKILPGGSGVEELAHLSPESMTRLFRAFDALEPVPDLFLLDTAAGIHPNVLQFVFAADQVIVVTTPEPTAYVDAYALIKTLVNHEPDKEIGLLINMAKDSREALHVIRLLLQLCRTALKTGFNNLGFILRDEEVARAVRSQQPFIIKSPHCQASKSLKHIASTILQIEPSAESRQGISGFFKRMFASRQPKKKAAGS